MRLVSTGLLLASLCLCVPASSLAECGPEQAVDATTIFGGQTIEVGNLAITNDDCDLILRAVADDGWSFWEAHAYAGVDQTPTNGGGNPAPGRFPYGLNFSTPVSDFEFRIPLASLGLSENGCGESVWIALHVVVGNGSQEETGWAFGQEFAGRRWGWELPYTIGCDEDECDDGEGGEGEPGDDEGCTGTG